MPGVQSKQRNWLKTEYKDEVVITCSDQQLDVAGLQRLLDKCRDVTQTGLGTIIRYQFTFSDLCSSAFSELKAAEVPGESGGPACGLLFMRPTFHFHPAPDSPS